MHAHVDGHPTEGGEFGQQAYTDGGVFDNLGVRMFRVLERPVAQIVERVRPGGEVSYALQCPGEDRDGKYSPRWVFLPARSDSMRPMTPSPRCVRCMVLHLPS